MIDTISATKDSVRERKDTGRNLRRALAGAIAAILLAAPLAAQAQTPTYSYAAVDLGSLGTVVGSATTNVPSAVNNAGQVVGTDGAGDGFLWQNGAIVDLGGFNPTAINNVGQAAGYISVLGSDGVYHSHAALWQNGTTQDLGLLPGYSDSQATAINDTGQVTGYASLAASNEVFLWDSASGMHDLGLAGGTSGINTSGQIVGATLQNGVEYPIRWTPNTPNGTVGSAATISLSSYGAYGVAINATGTALCRVYTESTYNLYGQALWNVDGTSQSIDLSVPVGGEPYNSRVDGLTDAGQVVASIDFLYDSSTYYTYGDTTWDVVWDSKHGARNLDTLISSGAPLSNHLDLEPLNSSGGLIVTGYYDYNTNLFQYYLLTPSALPATPGGLSAARVNGQAQLSWSPSEGVTGYNVKRSTTSGGPYTTVASGVPTASYTDSSIAGGSDYYYVISASNGYGESDNSIEAALPPPAPTGLAATPGNWQVSLSWNPSVGATAYFVYRATTSGGPYTERAEVVGTGYVDSASNGTTYFYVVAAWNSGGLSGYSNEASTTPASPPPPAPTGLSASAGDQQVALTWNASAGATGYAVRRGTTAGGPYPYEFDLSGAATSFTDTGLTNGVTYYYAVAAINAGGYSTNSNEARATPTGAPAAPTGLTAKAGKRKVSLAWTQSASPNVQSNRVYRSTTNGGPYTLVATIIPGTTYSDGAVKSGVAYYYRVTAVSASGQESAYSNQASATPH